MNKKFLILITILFSVFLINTSFALTTIVDVNIQYANVPTWQGTCLESQRSSTPYITGQDQYLELTYPQDGNDIYVSGEQLSYLSAYKAHQKVATFAFERDSTRTYNLRISVLPKRTGAYIHNNCMYGATANINCQLNQSPGVRDTLDVKDCFVPNSSIGSYGCVVAVTNGLLNCFTLSHAVNLLEIPRNCKSSVNQFGQYVYSRYTYTWSNFSLPAPYTVTEVDPNYPNRYCIDLGTISKLM